MLTMINELDNLVIFSMDVRAKGDFHLQRATIITWRESQEHNADDRAISFQEPEGVKEIWEFICKAKGIEDESGNIGIVITEEISNSNIQNSGIKSGCVLPDVTVDNLPFIAHVIQSEKETLAEKINEEVMENNCHFIKKLGELIDIEEKNKKNNESTDALSYIFVIFKYLFLLAKRELIEVLVSDEFYTITFGALEYDLESQKKIRHRMYFKDVAKFKNVLNLDNKEIISKIHINHRLGYLRDTAIGRFIEEITYININIILQTNNAMIIQYFIDNKSILHKCVLNIMDQSLKEEQIRDNILFLLELIACTKEFQQKKVQFYELLIEQGFLDGVESLLNKEVSSILKSNVLEIIVELISYVPSLFRAHILNNIKAQSNILIELCDILITHKDFGIKYEIGKIIIYLLDNEKVSNGMNNKPGKTDLYSMIFDNCLNVLVNFLSTPLPLLCDSELKVSNISAKQIIIEILCDCLNQHENLIQYWLIQNNVLTKILDLVKYNNKLLNLQVVKYIKCIIINNDYNSTKVIMNTDCFGKIISLFNINKKKDNLIFSAILELFFLLKNCSHSRKLINYLIENYYDFVYNESNRVYFEDIISLYENQNENEFGLYTVSHINKEESEEHIEEGNDSLGFIGLFNKTKNDDVDFDLDNDNINSNFNFLGTKRNSEEKLDELIQELKKENDEQ